MINHSVVIQRQDSLDQVIYQNSLRFEESYSLVKLFKSFTSEEAEDMVSFFGDLGKRIKAFSTAVSNEAIPPKNDLLVETIQAYCYARYANKSKMSHFLNIFQEEIIKNLNKDEFLYSKNNKLYNYRM